jgi:tight adherence protein B
MDIAAACLTLVALTLAGAARRHAVADRFMRRLAPSPPGARKSGLASWGSRRRWITGALGALIGGALGMLLVGPMGVVLGVGAGTVGPLLWARRHHRMAQEVLESQLADLAAAIAVAVRSGLSIAQAVAFAAEEAELPLRDHLDRIIAEQAVGASLETALVAFADAVGSDDARLLVLILSTHARTGGNLAVALEEVAETLRHRFDARRELRALTAQGRVSGLILGTLPIGFFLVLAATSRQDLGPVYRSAAGLAMVAGGLVLEGLAYLWIRRILSIEA